ncbi:phosphonate C-P lyase system protein PhnG [Rhodobacter sp.]
MPNSADPTRRDWMSLLAKAPPARLAALLPELPAHDLLRAPEIGAIMVQGRTGGTGAPFNLGEMTVTRCSLRLAGGAVGHAMVQGRDRAHATRAAAADALMQTAEAARIEVTVLAPLRNEAAERRRTRAAKAAATRVEFFTLMRGEDQ